MSTRKNDKSEQPRVGSEPLQNIALMGKSGMNDEQQAKEGK